MKDSMHWKQMLKEICNLLWLNRISFTGARAFLRGSVAAKVWLKLDFDWLILLARRVNHQNQRS